jgi:hypothetical protein
LCNPIFTFLDSRRGDRRSWNEWQQTLPEFSRLLISSPALYAYETLILILRLQYRLRLSEKWVLWSKFRSKRVK